MGLYLKDTHMRIDYVFDLSVCPAARNVEASALEAKRTSARSSNRVTLSDGQVDERSISFRVEER